MAAHLRFRAPVDSPTCGAAPTNTNPTVNINYPVDGVRPYPQFGRVGEDRSTQENRYTGFYVKLDKRLSDRYYTW
jgi:hypothetical protein